MRIRTSSKNTIICMHVDMIYAYIGAALSEDVSGSISNAVELGCSGDDGELSFEISRHGGGFLLMSLE